MGSKPEAKPQTPPFVTKPPAIRQPEPPPAKPKAAEEPKAEEAALQPGQKVTFPAGENVAFREKYGERVPGTLVSIGGQLIEDHGGGRKTVLVKVGKQNHTVDLAKVSPAEAFKPRFVHGNTIHWTAPDGRKLKGYITSVSDTAYRVRAHPAGEATPEVATTKARLRHRRRVEGCGHQIGGHKRP